MAPPRPLLFFCGLVLSCGDSSASGDGNDGGTTDTSTSAATGTTGDGEGSGADMGDLPPELICANEPAVVDGPCYQEYLYIVGTDNVAYGDFNGDGRLDIAAEVDAAAAATPDTVSLWAGEPGGTFADGEVMVFDDDPTAVNQGVGLADLRVMGGTGAADRLFVQGTYGSFGDVQIDVWWSNGAASLGRFFGPTDMPPAGPWFGDFDGDGASDLVFAVDPLALETLEVHACTTSGCSGAQLQAATGAPGGPWVVLAGEVTGDSREDLVVVSRPATGSEAVVLTAGGGGFSVGTAISLGTDLSQARVTLEDLTGDGLPDLLAVNDDDPGSPGDTADTLFVYPGDGSSGFDERIEVDLGARATTVGLARYNDDDSPDLLLRFDDMPQVYTGLGNGDGTFGQGPIFTTSGEPTGVTGDLIPLWRTTTADLDEDGLLDILTVVDLGAEVGVSVLLSGG